MYKLRHPVRGLLQTGWLPCPNSLFKPGLVRTYYPSEAVRNARLAQTSFLSVLMPPAPDHHSQEADIVSHHFTDEAPEAQRGYLPDIF